MPRTTRLLLMLCALALLVPVAATAQEPAPAVIDGNPLNIFADGGGALQVGVEGAGTGEFYPPTTFDSTTGQPAPNPNTRAGFGITIRDPQGQIFQYGRFISGGLGTPESGPTLTDEFTIVTSWLLDAAQPAALRLTQTLHYQQGSRQVEASYAIQNLTGSPVQFRANIAGDLAIRGSDSGVGFMLGGPPTRFIGGLNQDVGAAGGFVEETPWTSFETNNLGLVGQHASDTTSPGGFDNTVSVDPTDNAAGVQWDDFYTHGLAAGATATFNVALRFVDTLGLSPASAIEQIGDRHVVTASAASLEGVVQAGKQLRYEISGANPDSGTVTTDSKGQAEIAWVGGQFGNDVLTVFADQNANNLRDENEPQATATVEWQGTLPAPTIGQSADVKVVSGTVKIKLPKGTSPIIVKRLGFSPRAKGFQALTLPAQIPMGSTLDTSRGTVQLLTAGSKPSATTGQSKFQSGNFRNGQFRLSQTTKNPLVQLSMTGGNLKGCNTRVPKGGAARKKGRRLFGNAHGRFRSRGRNSSATVRGTKWTMTDTCAGTLTSVSRGSVVVRDFTLRKNKTVKAGHKYLAKAPKRKLRKGR